LKSVSLEIPPPDQGEVRWGSSGFVFDTTVHYRFQRYRPLAGCGKKAFRSLLSLSVISPRGGELKEGKPQQNGRHERMHRTLKAETASPPATNLAAQQQRFECFRAEFNQERPHEALGQTVPAAHYQRSPRRYPARLADPAYPAHFELRRVRSNGEIKWQGELVYLSKTLTGEVTGLAETPEGDAEVWFGPIHLGTIDGVTLKFAPSAGRGIAQLGGDASSALRRKRGAYAKRSEQRSASRARI